MREVCISNSSAFTAVEEAQKQPTQAMLSDDKVLTAQGSKFIILRSCKLIKLSLALLLFQS